MVVKCILLFSETSETIYKPDNYCKLTHIFFFFFFFFFHSPQLILLILQKANGQFQRKLSLFKVQEGVQHFPGGVQLFPGGSNCLFPIENHKTCDFPGGGGSRPPVPPSGSALVRGLKILGMLGTIFFSGKKYVPFKMHKIIYFSRKPEKKF